MKAFLVSLTLLASATPALATEINSFIQTHRIRGCDSWEFSSDARGHVCRFPGMSINVADGYTVSTAIRELEIRVSQLEEKIRNLEAKQP